MIGSGCTGAEGRAKTAVGDIQGGADGECRGRGNLLAGAAAAERDVRCHPRPVGRGSFVA
jgi:hypothetical protein